MQVPQGESVDTLMVAMPKSSWVLGKGGKMLRVLNRPSWLMRGKEVLGKFVRVFYEGIESCYTIINDQNLEVLHGIESPT